MAKGGRTVVDRASGAAKDIEVLVTELADPGTAIEVFEGNDGVFTTVGSGAVVSDFSTISPATTRRIVAGLRTRGASPLDAPVFGNRHEAENGALGFVVGGDPKVFESVKDLLGGCMGKTAP